VLFWRENVGMPAKGPVSDNVYIYRGGVTYQAFYHGLSLTFLAVVAVLRQCPMILMMLVRVVLRASSRQGSVDGHHHRLLLRRLQSRKCPPLREHLSKTTFEDGLLTDF